MTDQPTTKTGKHLADIYELDEPGPFDSTRVGRIDLDDIKAIEAEKEDEVLERLSRHQPTADSDCTCGASVPFCEDWFAHIDPEAQR